MVDLDELKSDTVSTATSAGAAAADGLNAAASAASTAGAAAAEGLSTAANTVSSDISGAQSAYEGIGSAISAGASEFENISSLYTSDMVSAKDEIMKISGLAADSCGKLIPLLKLEIFRDFSQILSVVFTNVYVEVFHFMSDAKKWLGGLASTIAIDIGEAFRSKTAILVGVILAIVLGVLCIGMFIWMVFCSGISEMKMNARRAGHEHVEFSKRMEENKWTHFFVNITIIGATSLYLPITQVAFQVIFCDKTSFFLTYLRGDECASTFMVAISVLVLLVFSFSVPLFLYKQIQKHMPTGSPMDPEWTNDVDGLRVKFDDRIYNEMVENDAEQLANPFRELYRGYERKYNWWRVFIMVYKLALIMTVTLCSVGEVAAGTTGIATLLFVTFIFWFTYHAEPFVEPLNDTMDECGRLTTMIASIAGLINIYAGPKSNISNVVGFIVLLSGVVNGIFMISIIFSGVAWFRAFVKNTFGIFTFHDSCKNLSDLSAQHVIATWRLDREVKHRVWQAFWNNVLTKEAGEESSKRLVQLQRDAIDYGIHYIKDHWLALYDKQIEANRAYIRTYLEGVDLFYDDPKGTVDGRLDSLSSFGKMYVKPYPFHLVMVYDDCEDEAFIQGPSAIAKFIAIQNDPVIKQKVMKRKTIRALAMSDAKIYWPFERDEQRHVPDGTESYTDSKGKTRHRTVYSTITIRMSYKNCNVSLQVNTKLSHSAGFKASFEYNDGSGQARKPRTGHMHVENATHCSMPLTHIGFTDAHSFETTDRYMQFLASASKSVNIQEKLADLLKIDSDYRKNLINKFEEEKGALSNAFWYFVFNNPNLKREELERYLKHTETNKFLKSFPETDKKGLDYLYKRMEVINRNDASRLWFIFWEDFYYQNLSTKVVTKNTALFDPTNASAMCYKNPPTKEVLKDWLRNIGIERSCIKSYFSDEALDMLYDRIQNPTKYPIDFEANRKGLMAKIFGSANFAA